MTALITLDVAKQHLRILPEDTDDDADIQRKIDEAQAIVLDYIKKTPDPTPQPPDGVTAGIADFDAGAQAVVLPDWAQLPFTAVMGSAADLESGSLRIHAAGQIGVELRLGVLHNWGSQVVLGYSIDGGAVVEFARVTIESSDYVPVIVRTTVALTAESLAAFYISSNFEYAAFSWTEGDVTIFDLPDDVAVTPPWVPTTSQSRILEAATLMVLSKLYDDRNVGEENDERVALGYLSPQVTAILHRLRDPAVA